VIYFLVLLQYHFDPHTGAWEHKQFKKEHGETLFSLHDISYNETGMTSNTKEVCKDYEGTLDDIAEAAKRVFNQAVVVNKEISTVEEEVIEFTDDRNQLVWFLQPNEAQFYLAAETLKYKPKPFGRAKSPFTPKHGHSPRVSPQISPAGSDPDLRMNVHVDGHVDSSSDDSEDATQKHTSPQAGEDRDPKGSYKKVAGGKKKRDVMNKIKHALCHVPRH